MNSTANHPAILIAADSPEKLRPCDAWRVYDTAIEMGADDLDTVKAILKEKNEAAYLELMEYEEEENAA